jgi:hypothetical protein
MSVLSSTSNIVSSKKLSRRFPLLDRPAEAPATVHGLLPASALARLFWILDFAQHPLLIVTPVPCEPYTRARRLHTLIAKFVPNKKGFRLTYYNYCSCSCAVGSLPLCLTDLFQMAFAAARDDDLVSELMECFGKRSANA